MNIHHYKPTFLDCKRKANTVRHGEIKKNVFHDSMINLQFIIHMKGVHTCEIIENMKSGKNFYVINVFAEEKYFIENRVCSIMIIIKFSRKYKNMLK